MNLFREVRRRRSLSRENNNGAGGGSNNNSPNLTSQTAANGHASLRRSLMPRSRTASNDLHSMLKGATAAGDAKVEASKDSGGGNASKNPIGGTLSASATSAAISKVTDWSYCRPPKAPEAPTEPQEPQRSRPRVPARSASLGRGQRKACSRSVTLPNFQETDQLAQTHQLALQQKNFSTFKQDGEGGQAGVRFRHVDRSKRASSSSNARPRSADLSSEASSSSSGANVSATTQPSKRLPNSNSSEFFRVVQDRLAAIEAAAAAAAAGTGLEGVAKDYSSLESLLEDEDSSSCANIVTAVQYDSLELLDEAEEDALKRMMCAKSSGVPLDSLDSQPENESSNSSANNSVSLSSSSKNNNDKYNSLPRSVFGSIQLKVQEIKGQIDVLKIPQHLNQKPSGVPKSALQLLGLNGIAGSFQSSSSVQDTDPLSSSPRSLSPAVSQHNRTSALPPHVSAAGANESSSPSTLSPCSSNSLPSAASAASGAPGPPRPQVLRLPQSHSFNSFGQLGAAKAELGPPGSYTPSAGPSSQRERLVFFFDIINTQEKIAKVRRRRTKSV